MNLNFAGYGVVKFTPEKPNFLLKDSDFKDLTTREVDRISKIKPKLANAFCNDTSYDEEYLIASSPPGIMDGDSGGPLVRFDKKSKKTVIIGIAFGKNIAD